MKSQIEHEIQMEGVETRFLKLCDEVLPDFFPAETERGYLNKIRISFLNKVQDFSPIDREINPVLVKTLDENNLQPSNLPPFFDGKIPDYRHDICLAFKNILPEDNPLEEGEYFLIEPAFLTYFRDKNLNYIHVRAFFESYGFYFLHEVWKDVGMDLAPIIASWIKYCRITLGTLLTLVSHDSVDKSDLIDFPLAKFINDSFEETMFPISALFLESQMIKNRSTPNTSVLIQPASSFEEKEAVKILKEVKEEVAQGGIQGAVKRVMDVLKVFSRHKQKQGILECLLLLAQIAKRMNQLDQSRKYLTDALNIARELPEGYEDLLTRVQERLAALYLEMNDPDHAFTYYNSILDKLKQTQLEHHKRTGKRKLELEKRRAMIHLELVKVYTKKGDYTQAKLEFKEAMNLASSDPDVQAKYHAYLADYHAGKENENRATQSLKKVWQLADRVEDKSILVQPLSKLARFLLFDRKSPSKAAKILLKLEEILSLKDFENLPALVKIYEMLADAYKQNNDEENARFYSNRILELRKALKLKGWIKG